MRSKVEAEPKPIEPFLTLKVYEGTSGCNAEIPEFGIGLAARDPAEARRSLIDIVRAQSRLFLI